VGFFRGLAALVDAQGRHGAPERLPQGKREQIP